MSIYSYKNMALPVTNSRKGEIHFFGNSSQVRSSIFQRQKLTFVNSKLTKIVKFGQN